MSGETRRGARVAAFGITARAITQTVTVAITIVAARYLDPASFGIFSLAAVATVLGRTLLYVGAYEYMMKSDEPEIYSLTALTLNVLIAVIFSIFMLSIGWAVAPHLGGPIFMSLLLVLAPSNLLAAVSAWQEALVLRRGKLNSYYLVTILAEVAAGIGAVVLLELGWGLTALAIQLYLRAVFLSAGFTLVDRPAFDKAPTGASLRTVAAWSRHRYGAVVTNYLSNYAADFIIGLLLSPAATGLYRTGSRLVTAASDLFTQPANLVCRTAFSRLVREGEEPEAVWPDALLIFGFLAGPALAGLAVLSNEIVAVALGPTWQGATPVVTTLCLARAFGIVPSILSPLFIVRDRQRTVLLIQAFAAIATVVGLMWSAQLGLFPAAATVALVQGLVAVVMVARLASLTTLDTRRLIRITGIIILATTTVSAAAQATLIATPGGGLPSIVAAVGAGAVIWGCWVFVFRRRLAISLSVLQ